MCKLTYRYIGTVSILISLYLKWVLPLLLLCISPHRYWLWINMIFYPVLTRSCADANTPDGKLWHTPFQRLVHSSVFDPMEIYLVVYIYIEFNKICITLSNCLCQKSYMSSWGHSQYSVITVHRFTPTIAILNTDMCPILTCLTPSCICSEKLLMYSNLTTSTYQLELIIITTVYSHPLVGWNHIYIGCK